METKEQVLRLPQVLNLVGFKRSRLYDLIRTGEFPAPRKLTRNGRAVGWAASAVDAWVAGVFSGSGKAA